ncbi:unnamed protein product [Adineta steineri]|uniref:GDP-mannose 4,6-dehydratase n=1 Tax=Adineta steineri TaxID=433720 RepID=A0A819RM71_9BILA|nr:unnamed protein product [Adineta steineri]CAF4050126.1 unnamed protein product [Adineta steineri]
MTDVISDSDSIQNNSYRVALITGITGQDGSYLADFLLNKGYEVVLKLHYGDLNDISSLINIIKMVKPIEIYNLAGMSDVKLSFDLSEYTANIDALGPLRILEAIRICQLDRDVRLYQASTAELYGRAQEIPQSEITPFHPCSPYAAAKLYAYWITINYREAYDMFAVNGILFNHESPRRGNEFVTRKITRAVAKVHLNRQEILELGALDAKHDWGHARDFVEAMWLMLQHDTPEDFVIATGEMHSIREFVEVAFQEINREIIWEGEGVNEVGKEKDTNIIRVIVNPKHFRPSDVDLLVGNAKKAEEKLKWKPKSTFKGETAESSPLDSSGFNWIQVDSWIHMDSHGFTWIQMDSNGFRWIQMDSDGFKWIQVESHEIS